MVPIAHTVFEARVGGTVYDAGTAASAYAWAWVLVCEPPYQFVISWNISPRWQIEPDPDRTK